MTGFHNLQRIERMHFDFPKYTFSSLRHFHLEGFRNPVPGFEWLPVPDFYQYQFIEEILLVASVFFIFGLFTRAAGILISVVYLYLFLLSQFTYHHHIFNFVIAMLILGFSTCNDRYSLDSMIFGIGPDKRKILPIRLIQVFVSIVYTFSFIQKLNYPWISGDIVILFLTQQTISGDFTEFINSLLSKPYNLYFWKALGPFTVFGEGLLAFGLWVPRLRRFTILVGVLLHTGIDITIGVSTFSFQMMALYIAFIYPESKQNTVYYDGKKIQHRLLVLFGRLFDWLQRIRWTDYNSDGFSRRGIENTGGLKFARQSGRPSGGIKFVYGVTSLLPLTFVFSFIPGLYLFIKKRVNRLKKPGGQ